MSYNGLMTAQEAAEFLDVTVTTVYTMRKRGILKTSASPAYIERRPQGGRDNVYFFETSDVEHVRYRKNPCSNFLPFRSKRRQEEAARLLSNKVYNPKARGFKKLLCGDVGIEEADYATTSEAAAIIGRSPITILNYIYDGILTGIIPYRQKNGLIAFLVRKYELKKLEGKDGRILKKLIKRERRQAKSTRSHSDLAKEVALSDIAKEMRAGNFLWY
jgi:hypothetical protein